MKMTDKATGRPLPPEKVRQVATASVDDNPRYVKFRELHPDLPSWEFGLWIQRHLRQAVRDREPFTTEINGGCIIDQDAWTDYLQSRTE